MRPTTMRPERRRQPASAEPASPSGSGAAGRDIGVRRRRRRTATRLAPAAACAAVGVLLGGSKGALAAADGSCQAALDARSALTQQMAEIASGSLDASMQVWLAAVDYANGSGESQEARDFTMDFHSTADVGNYHACAHIGGHHQCEVRTSKNGMDGASSAMPTMRVGLCMPEACEEDDVLEYVVGTYGEATEVSLDGVFEAYCSPREYELDEGAAVMVLLYCILALCVLLGTCMGRAPPGYIDSRASTRREADLIMYAQGKTFTYVMRCFDVVANFGHLCQRRPVQDDDGPEENTNVYERNKKLPKRTLDGMRSLSLCLLLGPELVRRMARAEGYDNYADVFPVHSEDSTAWYARWQGQILAQGSLGVDTLLFISGFLATKLCLRAQVREKEKWSGLGPGAAHPDTSLWGRARKTIKLFLKRYARTTLLYVVVLLTYAYLFKMFGGGLWWRDQDPSFSNCHKHMYLNFLYINNWELGDDYEYAEDACYDVSWLLSVDFQYFLMTPLIVFLYVNVGTVVGYVVTVGLIVASTIYTFVASYAEDWSVSPFDGSSVYEGYYVNSLTRVAPYLVGVLFSCLWYEWSRERYAPNPYAGSEGWRYQHKIVPRYALGLGLLSAFLLLSAMYGPVKAYNRAHENAPYELNEDATAFYLAFARPAWTLGVAILCFLCFNGQGGAAMTILTNTWFCIPARLVFAAYLVHPMVFDWYLYSQNRRGRLNVQSFTTLYVGLVALTMMVSAVAYVCIELPAVQISKYLNGRIHSDTVDHGSSFGSSVDFQEPLLGNLALSLTSTRLKEHNEHTYMPLSDHERNDEERRRQRLSEYVLPYASSDSSIDHGSSTSSSYSDLRGAAVADDREKAAGGANYYDEIDSEQLLTQSLRDETTRELLMEGMRVQVRSRGGKRWFGAKVVEVTDEGLYAVEYDDGERAYGIRDAFLRPIQNDVVV